MRRILIAILCLFLLTTAVSAAGSVSNLQSNTTIDSDGTCEVTLTMQLSVDGADDALLFPIPGNAKDISLNGELVEAKWSNGKRWVDLSSAVYGAGSHSVTIHYSLPDLVTEEKSGLVLTLPLLSGFSYPVDEMKFSVTFPGEIEEKPTFASTYHPETVESFMEYTVEGSVISGRMLQDLKDYETLTMTLLFPQNMAKRWSLSNDDLLQYALTLLAVTYWLIFLRCMTPSRIRTVQAPDGITAGELGCHLAGQGTDFPAMMLSWAQMGYLTIQVERSGRVLLHKDMDMGNERSEFEMRCFKKLFGKRLTVDAGGQHVAGLGRKSSKTIPSAWHYFKKSSGNPVIFRVMAALIGAVAGSSLAAGFVTDTVWVVLLSILLVPFGAISAWLIQSGVQGAQLRHRSNLVAGIICCLLWGILGSLAGELTVAIYVIITQLLAGLGVTYGGRRTEAGLQVRDEILGLRKYLKTIPKEDVQRILEYNPDYYFTMAPYAVALGVDKAFARPFRDVRLSPCPYVMVDGKEPRDADQWNEQIRQILQVMDTRQRKLPFEKILGK